MPGELGCRPLISRKLQEIRVGGRGVKFRILQSRGRFSQERESAALGRRRQTDHEIGYQIVCDLSLRSGLRYSTFAELRSPFLKGLPMKHILLVEDEENLIDIVASVLSDEGYEVRKSLTAEDALREVPHYHPDLIISDMKMGAVDGFTLFQKVRNGETSGKVPFIFLTALDDSWAKQKAKSIGVTAYVTKPFDVDEFVKLVKTVLP